MHAQLKSTLLARASEAWLSSKGKTDDARFEQFLHAELMTRDELGVDDSDLGNAAVYTHMLSNWAETGFGWLRTDETLAASLMCTSLDGLDLSDLRCQWRTFLVELPGSLITSPSGKAIDFACVERPHAVSPLLPEDSRWRISLFDELGDSVESDFFEDFAHMVKDSPRVARALHLVAKLAVGLLLSLATTPAVAVERYSATRPTLTRSGTPAHRITVIGRPVVVDVRDAVREYLGGRRLSVPAVQSLVRGHYKRQAHGAGRVERRIIWVEPYWRGPEDAPIVARPIVVGVPCT